MAYISESIDQAELITLRFVVDMLKNYDVKLVIETLEKDIKEKEAKNV
jgi:hypothetical protein